MLSELRQSPRYQILCLVRLEYGHEENIEATTLNYSQEGLLCRTGASIPTGAPLAILLDVDGTGWTVSVDAVCIRQIGLEDGSFEIGLKILDASSPAHAKLLEFFHSTTHLT